MFRWESRRTRRSGRKASRPVIATRVESLEERQLLTYSPLGLPFPDLSVKGYAASVTAQISNTTASSVVQPLSLEPGAFSTADAPASKLGVYISKSPRSLAGGFEVGRIDVPIVNQNSFQTVTGTLTLPQRPAGFPADGGRIYVYLRVNDANQFTETDTVNNFSRSSPVKIQAPLPELAVVGLDLPPVISPGDTVQPNIRIANLGTADPGLQGNVQVSLVASTTPNFTRGSTIVATYTVASIPPQSLVPSNGVVLGDANLEPGNNIVTIAGTPVTVPASPSHYYLGVIIDPNRNLKQLQTVPQNRRGVRTLALARVVGNGHTGLGPAGVNVDGGTSLTPIFPFSPSGMLVGASVDGVFPATLYPNLVATGTGTGPIFFPGPIYSSSTTTNGVASSSTSAVTHRALAYSAQHRAAAIAARARAAASRQNEIR